MTAKASRATDDERAIKDKDWEGYTVKGGITYTPQKRPVCRCPVCKVPASVITSRGDRRYHKCLGHTHPFTGQKFLGCGHGFQSINWKVKSHIS